MIFGFGRTARRLTSPPNTMLLNASINLSSDGAARSERSAAGAGLGAPLDGFRRPRERPPAPGAPAPPFPRTSLTAAPWAVTAP
jgi:hypothetical protein